MISNSHPAVDPLFGECDDIPGIMHFAASKAMGESIAWPLPYYQSTMAPIPYMLKKAKKINRSFNFIFGPSCIVYGPANKEPGGTVSPSLDIALESSVERGAKINFK